MFSIKRKLGREVGPRRNFVRILVSNLIMHGKMATTDVRAREIRPIVEKLITIARRHELKDLRTLLSRLPHASAMKLYHEIGPRYIERKGGYTRIVKGMEVRKRDGTRMATIEFI